MSNFWRNYIAIVITINWTKQKQFTFPTEISESFFFYQLCVSETFFHYDEQDFRKNLDMLSGNIFLKWLL